MVDVVTNGDPRIRTETLESILGSDHTVRSTDLSTTDRVIEAAADAYALIVDVSIPVPAEVFEQCPELAVVARAGAGVDNIDISAANDHDVTVVNVPNYCTEEVSTHAVSLLLASLRRMEAYDRSVEVGGWDWTAGQPIQRLGTQTVGFHSFGGIAQRTAEKLAGFGCDLVAADPYVDAEEMAEYGVEKVSFWEMLDVADHISIHAPLTEETHHLFDREVFQQMSSTGVLVNAGRGPIVKEEALAWALDTGQIAAAGVDVLEEEPPEESPLIERDDVLVTPHSAFYSEQSVTDLNEHMATDILAVLAGEKPDGYIDPDAEWL
ncbi:C-terminal binding protein [Halobacteriaceae archaeon SHR40]|mgnify:FL=1|uniref:C-terminal binding protein n=1 Tax=Halovenus amylolytica TaxID=2500550 RepID=UPI000FE436D2